VAWATGVIGFVHDTPELQPTAHEAASPAAPDAPSAPSSPGHPTAGPHPAEPAAPVARYVVCGREETPARLYELSSRVPGAALWAVSCGSTAHVIAIEAEQGVVLARRVALLQLPSPAPDRVPRAAPIALLEAEPAWLVSTLRVDRNGSPAGGALFRVPLASDPIASASRVHDASPGALALATLDRTAGQDFAVLQLGDARVAQAGELWLFSGGPAPQRIARRTVEPSAEALAKIDLDGDGLDEVAVLTRGAPGHVTVHAVSDQTPALTIDVPESDGLYAFDLDGDGKQELVTSGRSARSIAVASNSGETKPRQLTARPVTELDGLRDLIELDADADGRTEIAGYAHPEVIAVTPAHADAPSKRSVLFELSGEGLAVLQAQATHLDGDGAIDLIALVTTESNDPHVELLLATRPAGTSKSSALIQAPSTARELRNAPLLRVLELR
jgi:hypothetical protein